MYTTVSNRLNLVLGRAEDQGSVSLDLAASPHTLVVGPCNTGKTVALRRLAASALEQGFDVVMIDAVKRGADFRALADRVTLVRDGKEAVETLEGLVAEMTRRKVLLQAHDAFTVTDLPTSEDLKPILVVIDEYAATVIHSELPRDCDKEATWYLEAQERNAQAEMIKYLTVRILREARSAGIHLVIGTQRPDYPLLRPEVMDHLGRVIVTVRPSKAISPTMVAMVIRGGMAAEMAVNAALARAAGEQTRGHAVLVTEHTVTPLRISLLTED